MRSWQHSKRAFTLVELLVVIAIVGLLIAMSLPAVLSAREAARRTTCVSRMRQSGLGILEYQSATAYFPPGRTGCDDTGDEMSHKVCPPGLPPTKKTAASGFVESCLTWSITTSTTIWTSSTEAFGTAMLTTLVGTRTDQSAKA